MQNSTIFGAVIIHDVPDLDAVISLLALRLQDRLKYQRYVHAYELNIHHNFDFILLGSLEALKGIVHLYQSRGRDVPLILHVAHPTQLGISYHELFPHVQIIPIAQADLDDMDETLQFLTFETVLEALAS